MGSSANITNIDHIIKLKPSLIRFGENTQVALRSTENEASRVLSWLQRERLPHWKRQIRIKAEEAVRANTKLITQTTGDHPRPSVDARKAYELAKRQTRHAEEKYEQTRYWIRTLEKESVRYRAAIQPVAELARFHMTTAISKIDSLVNALDAYTSTDSPPKTLNKEPNDDSSTPTMKDDE